MGLQFALVFKVKSPRKYNNMFDDRASFLSRAYLQSMLDFEFRDYLDSGKDTGVLSALAHWAKRAKDMTETQDESAFIKVFFEGLWGHGLSGAADEHNHTIVPKYAVPGLGWFRGRKDAVPQVLCEFKDIRSKLDQKQNRKGANQTPIEQCLNYVRAARRETWGNEPVQFWKLLQRDQLISESGKPALWRLVEKQGKREHKIEEEFYAEYRAFRDRLYDTLKIYNRDFKGTPTELLRTTQRLLDRFIFAFYCEDMGERMLFPPQFIKDELSDRSKKAYYEEKGSDIWEFMLRLFKHMNTGGMFGRQKVPHINGGLFAEDPLLESLQIPNFIFAAPGQGDNEASLLKDRRTLLFLSAYYNYAAKGDGQQSLTLYTLGRIFEQSITELEYKVGEIEGRDTVAKLSKRKRDGVYYTPEWVVNYLVRETFEPWFKAARAEAGWGEDELEPKPEALKAYYAKLRAIKVIDPACGSGAFLIGAFRKLLEERKRCADMMQRRAIKDDSGVGFDETPIVADILRNNIWGVDINPASVEISKLALWLHSARAHAPLSTLNANIVCGNSLVAGDVWAMVKQTPEAEARINPFDWHGSFAEGGFDIVLGNPPYVKLQNLMKVDPEVVAYLRAPRVAGTYESAQTGNFDLYLPFIEKGLRLLAKGGRMAYIAPSLWTVNEYGEGLRRLIHRTQQLERWLDFKSFQVFDEAITYTALQFFTQASNSTVNINSASDGEIGDLTWNSEKQSVAFEAFEAGSEWLLATGNDRSFIVNRTRSNLRLDSPSVSSAIIVGVQTSADKIYHLQRVGKNKFTSKAETGLPLEVELENSATLPLVSGEQAKRYAQPQTDLHTVFPYHAKPNGQLELLSVVAYKQKFPNCFTYLQKFEKLLRKRESSSFDDEQWYRFGRSQNIDKQHLPKLMVPRLVTDLKVSFDRKGEYCLDNVDVGGVIPATECDPDFLCAVLNASVANFVFRRTSKPFQHEYLSANKQFIAPLPVPRATPEQQQVIATKARKLQELWTLRRDLLREVEDRLSVLSRLRFKFKTLWPDLPSVRDIALPKNLSEKEKSDYRKEEIERLEEEKLTQLQGFLDTTKEWNVDFTKGELRLSAEGRVVLSKIFLPDNQGPLVAQYWRYVISRRMSSAKSFAEELGKYPAPDATEASRQFIERVDAVLALRSEILAREHEMNEALYDLYGLSTDERQLIEEDCTKRPLL
ncbi:MAG: Eco57I restriction-modification methylase domain-containing protein [Pseudomonadota bacterium]|nr:Eco57I restriction-modification methylase domain-containing protein [Pseudomonadota bacterium]